jgi:hypothetical protein
MSRRGSSHAWNCGLVQVPRPSGWAGSRPNSGPSDSAWFKRPARVGRQLCFAKLAFLSNNKLHGLASASNGKWSIAGVFLQSADQVAAFKARVNLQAKSLPDVDFRRFGVRSTPTALLVDREGIVRKVWVGASRAGKSAMLAALQSSHVD